MDKKYIVYVHICKFNQKIYIGQTCQKLNERSGVDGNGYKGCDYFYNAIQKYGWKNFKHIILLENLSKEQADIFEEELILKYNSNNANYGYNLKSGGANNKYNAQSRKKMSNSQKKLLTPEKRKYLSSLCKGKKLTQEHKQKISESLKGHDSWSKGFVFSEESILKMKQSAKNRPPVSAETRIKMGISKIGNTYMLGKHLSEESKRKISEKRKGLIFSDDTLKKMSESHKGQVNVNRKQVYQFSLDGILIAEYVSVEEAGRVNHIEPKNISSVCLGKRKTAGGFYWSYSMVTTIVFPIRPQAKPIKQIDISTNKIIRIFDSVKQAERETNIHDSNIINVCKGKYKQAGGYFWEYA